MKNVQMMWLSLLALVATPGCANLCFLSGTCPATPDKPDRPDRPDNPKPQYASCAAAKSERSNAADGDYQIKSKEKIWTAYCAMNADGGPAEYLTLVGPNYFTYAAGGSATGINGATEARTRYLKVRVKPDTLEVDAGDRKFAFDSGGVTVKTSGDPWSVKSVGFGSAGSCNGEGKLGSGVIDLTGTPFAVAPDDFQLNGFGPGGEARYAQGNQVVTLTGGGNCGSIGPKTVVHLQFKQ